MADSEAFNPFGLISDNVLAYATFRRRRNVSEARRGAATIFSNIGRVRGREAPGRGPEAPRAEGERCAGAPYAVLVDVALGI